MMSIEMSNLCSRSSQVKGLGGKGRGGGSSVSRAARHKSCGPAAWVGWDGVCQGRPGNRAEGALSPKP